VYPQNAYRNGPLYAAYTATVMKGIMDLSAENQVSVEGMLTWAFEFEGQPYFDGLRTLATNGVDKPILNLFRMTGLMRGDRVEGVSSGTITAMLIPCGKSWDLRRIRRRISNANSKQRGNFSCSIRRVGYGTNRERYP
jgi:hypothetical protein